MLRCMVMSFLLHHYYLVFLRPAYIYQEALVSILQLAFRY